MSTRLKLYLVILWPSMCLVFGIIGNAEFGHILLTMAIGFLAIILTSELMYVIREKK